MRLLAAAAGVVMLYLEPLWVGIGLALLAAAILLQLATNRARGAPPPAPAAAPGQPERSGSSRAWG